MRVILYKGQSQYGALRTHVDQLAKAFKLVGHTSIVIDLLKNDAIEQLQKELNIGCNFVISFNGIGIDLKVGKKSVYDIVNIPFMAILVDHPLYHISRLDTKINKLVITCLDYKHLDFLTYFYEENHFKVKTFLLPGGNVGVSPNNKTLEEFLEKRKIPLLFTGSFRGIPRKLWRENENLTLTEIIDDICEYFLSEEYVSVEEAFDHVLREKKIYLSLEQEAKIKLYIIQQVLTYAQSYRRYQCLETIAKAGIPIEIYGSGWEEWASNWSSVKYNELGTVKNTLELLSKTRLCLNVNNNFVSGGHERVFNSMINGAPVITDRSLYYNEEFVEGKDIITYSWNNLDQIADKINDYLEKPELLWRIAQNGREKMLERHTWVHRAKEIIDLYNLSNI